MDAGGQRELARRFLGTIRHITLVKMTRADAADTSFRTGDVSIMRSARIAPDDQNIAFTGEVDTVPVSSAMLHYIGLNYNNSQFHECKSAAGAFYGDQPSGSVCNPAAGLCRSGGAADQSAAADYRRVVQPVGGFDDLRHSCCARPAQEGAASAGGSDAIPILRTEIRILRRFR